MSINQVLRSCSHSLSPYPHLACTTSPSLHLPLPPRRPGKASTEREDTGHPLLSVSGAGDRPQGPVVCVVPAMAMWFPVCRNWKLRREDSMGHFSQLPRQDYEALKESCLRDGSLFEDKNFPASLRSIGSGPLLRKLPSRLEWKRPPVRGLQTLCAQCGAQTVCPGLGAYSMLLIPT